jgi:ABC-2 type transport system ATP-binding protein/lipopolysaccharide transport system ATP-binding protein
MASIDLVGVHVDYPVYSARGRSLKSHIARTVGGSVMRADGHVARIRALEDIHISLKPGDRVALLGANGAGKSTLLKVMAGIVEPPIGTVEIVGRVSALLDMSMGMDPEATGYENILMRSVFLGATFEEAQARIPEIEEFSGLGEYLDFPLRTYSSGMIVRLCFAISTSIVPEILVLDENVGAADAAFSAKAQARIMDIVGKSQILAFATHSMQQAQSICTRGILLSRGRVQFDGPLQEAIATYGQAQPPVSAG